MTKIFSLITTQMANDRLILWSAKELSKVGIIPPCPIFQRLLFVSGVSFGADFSCSLGATQVSQRRPSRLSTLRCSGRRVLRVKLPPCLTLPECQPKSYDVTNPFYGEPLPLFPYPSFSRWFPSGAVRFGALRFGLLDGKRPSHRAPLDQLKS